MTDSTDNARGPERLPDYDAGLLNDWGGGNVEWWQDYLRAEIGKANDHWREVVADLAPDPLLAVKVKPLVWYKLGVEQKASTPFGPYIVASYDVGEWGCWIPNEDINDDPGHGFHSTEEAAKAYAQEHLASCIRSALEPCDPLADPRVVALRDAADALAKAVAFWEQAEEPDVSEAIYRLKRTAAKYRALAALSPTGGNADG